MLPANWSAPQSNRLRRGRHSMAGGLYLVTLTTEARKHLFGEFGPARLVSATMADPVCWPQARLLAWVLMPDHWHGLVELGGNEALARTIARVKAAATRQWNLEHGATGSLWAPGFHDRALRREDSLIDCARYIVLNPVRAGLVGRCGAYPFWDAVWL